MLLRPLGAVARADSRLRDALLSRRSINGIRVRRVRVGSAPDDTATKKGDSTLFLSDLIAFESDASPTSSASTSSMDVDPTAKAQEIIDRATRILEEARQALGAQAAANSGESGASDTAAAQPAAPERSPAARATPAAASASGEPAGRDGGSATAQAVLGEAAAAGEGLTRRWSSLSDDGDLTRSVLQSALDRMQQSGRSLGSPDTGGSSRNGGGIATPVDGDSDGHSPPPAWAQQLLGSDTYPSRPSPSASSDDGPQMQRQAAPWSPSGGGPATGLLPFAEDVVLQLPRALELPSQAAGDAARAATAVLPPLQSVVELTTAARPPERSGASPAEADAAAAAPVARQLADGSGVLADGTRWEKKSGVELGPNGYWKRWHLLSGLSEAGSVQWEEVWWEASDWTGLRELGANKSGRAADGSAWRETWSERMAYTSNALDTAIERTAHKWAADAAGDEWEEKWSEYYHSRGRTAKTADKWGKNGPNVWHERWGEEYDGGDHVIKWTDKWAERLLQDGAREQWGDKWREEFAQGAGSKNGEVWSVDAGGHRYQRWWGEDHYGDGRVRRHGHSTSGESWDQTISMDTYYNPIPHFGYQLALDHSPTLKRVPLQPKVGMPGSDPADPFGPGLDAL